MVVCDTGSRRSSYYAVPFQPNEKLFLPRATFDLSLPSRRARFSPTQVLRRYIKYPTREVIMNTIPYYASNSPPTKVQPKDPFLMEICLPVSSDIEGAVL